MDIPGTILSTLNLFEILRKKIDDIRNRWRNFKSNRGQISAVRDGDIEKTSKRLKCLQALYRRTHPSLSVEGRENWELEINDIMRKVRQVSTEATAVLNRLSVSEPTIRGTIERFSQTVREFATANTVAGMVERFEREAKSLFELIFSRIDRLESIRIQSQASSPSHVISPILPSVTQLGSNRIIPANSLPSDNKVNTVTKKYRIKYGDTLWNIANRECGNPARHVDIHEANKDIIPNPNFLVADMVITIPCALPDTTDSSDLMYVVKAGDTLSSISQNHFGDPARYMCIVAANQTIIDDPDVIFPGMKLRLPPVSD